MASSLCKECGGTLRRSRRTAFEKVFFAEALRCDGCRIRTRNPHIDLKNARYAKCPCCHSVDLTVLKRPDRIDRMKKGLLNVVQRLGGGKLYHCWFCRVQFYDTREQFVLPYQPEDKLLPAAAPDTTAHDVKLAS